MPKFFVIRDRLQQQQLRLQESQNLIETKSINRLNIEDVQLEQPQGITCEPLELVAKKRNTEDLTEHLQNENNRNSGELF